MLQLPAYVEDLRKEVRLLRVYTAQLKRANNSQKDKVRTLEEILKEKDKRIRELEKENGKLKQEIEKINKTNSRYQISLFDHGNFKHKDEGDTAKREKGGQTGHADTNREKQEDYGPYTKKRIFAKTCGKRHSPLSRVLSTKQKILLDIVINPKIVRMIFLSERQWCGNCKKEVIARDRQTLPFTEYGINTFMMTMILRFSCNSSMGNISKVLRIGYGLSLSRSDVSSLLKSSGKYLNKKYDELKQAIRNGKVMYADETGWLVHGQKAWMWIMTNEKQTVYIAAESRGGGIAEEMYEKSSAYLMTDGLASYTNIIPKDKHLYCWSHVLRFAFEETIKLQAGHPACQVRNRLVDLYRTIRSNPNWTREEKEIRLKKELEEMILIQSADQAMINILHRVRAQKEGLILALLITEDGTNNLAERELRNMAIKRTVSYGSDTYKGMETTAIIGSVIQTLQRNKEAPIIPALKNYLTESLQEKYHQYIHTTYYDL